jgi:hypothetical protein
MHFGGVEGKMSKRSFLSPMALSAAFILGTQQAVVPADTVEATGPEAARSNVGNEYDSGVVLHRSSDGVSIMAFHSSHASHASHASHCSSYSYCQ